MGTLIAEGTELAFSQNLTETKEADTKKDILRELPSKAELLENPAETVQSMMQLLEAQYRDRSIYERDRYRGSTLEITDFATRNNSQNDLDEIITKVERYGGPNYKKYYGTIWQIQLPNVDGEADSSLVLNEQGELKFYGSKAVSHEDVLIELHDRVERAALNIDVRSDEEQAAANEDAKAKLHRRFTRT